MIAWFVRNGIAANLLMLTIVIMGAFSLFKFVPLEVFPSSNIDTIIIKVDLRGATPEEIEQSISIKVEEAIADLEGIKHITSNSLENTSIVTVEVVKGYKARELLADIKSRIDAVNSFPQEAEKAVIELSIRKRSVMLVSLSSPYSEMETRQYAQNLRDQLLQINGISQVELSGVRDFEISVEVSQDKLNQYNLSIAEISNAIEDSSLNLSAGNLKTLSKDILVSTKKQAYNKEDFASIIIKENIDGSVLRLTDIARINDGFEETPIRSRFNGKRAVFIDVFRVGNESAIDVSNKVKNFIESQKSILPFGYELTYWDDESQIVKNRLETLGSSALQGSILILILLTLFLRPAIALWVFVGIPIAFAGAFIVLPMFGITLNILSLFGFILVLGIVVDDAIVTGENVYSHLNNAESGEMAAINGTKEIAIPVTFGALTTIAAFVPLAFVDGGRSALFNQLPYVVIGVLIFSLIESKFILPSHLKHIKLRDEKKEPNFFEKFQHKFSDGFEKSVLKYYQPLLELTLKNKFTTITLFISSFALVISLVMSGWTQYIYFPRVPSETISVSLTMPPGTAFETTNKHIMNITQKAEFLKKKYTDEITGESVVLNIMTTTGGRGGTSNVGQVRIEITAPEKREIKITSKELTREWRTLVGEIVGIQSIAYKSEITHGSSSPIDIQVSGSSLQELKQIANAIKIRLGDYETVFDVTDTLSNGKDEINVDLKPEAKLLGFTVQSVSSEIRDAIYGTQVQRVQRGRDDVRVMVRLPLEERKSVASLNKILITSPHGSKVPLENIALLTPTKGASSINRIDRFRTVNILADIEKEKTNMLILQSELRVFLDELISKYPNVKYTLEGESRDQQEIFGSLSYSLMAALFAIYVLLAVPLKSYIQPFIVMSIIPFGIVGAVVGHWIMGMPLTILSIMGMVALIGVLINASLVLVDYINQQYEKTGDLMSSIKRAGAARFRPVMLTSLTTFIGLLPLLFEKSTQAQFLIPMATSLAFGVLFSIFTTLILVPIIYVLVENTKAYLK